MNRIDSYVNNLVKAKPLPPGTRRQRKDGIYIKQPDGTWLKETEEKPEKKEEISISAESTEIINRGALNLDEVQKVGNEIGSNAINQIIKNNEKIKQLRTKGEEIYRDLEKLTDRNQEIKQKRKDKNITDEEKEKLRLEYNKNYYIIEDMSKEHTALMNKEIEEEKKVYEENKQVIIDTIKKYKTVGNVKPETELSTKWTDRNEVINVKEALNIFQSIIPDHIMNKLNSFLQNKQTNIFIERPTIQGRSYYDYRYTYILLSVENKTEEKIQDTLIHEMGHAIEDSNENVHRIVKEFLKKRIEGYEIESLNDIHGMKVYDDDEVAVKNNFVDAYMGKIYGHDATEILSMGLEYMFSKEKQSLFLEDKEYFNFMIGVLTAVK